MSTRALIAALIAQMGESLQAILGFLESLLKAAVGRALALTVAATIGLLWFLAIQHADDFTRPVLHQARDTLLAVLRQAQAQADAAMPPDHRSGIRPPPAGP